MNGKTTDDFFIILVPTRDGRMFIDTLHILEILARRMGREPMVVNCDGNTYWDARNNVIAKLRKTLRIHGIAAKDPVRALWIDSDILIDDTVENLVLALGAADSRGLNLISNYRTTWEGGRAINTVMLPNPDGTYRTASDSELHPEDGNTPAGIVGGLGFYYGSVPLGYEYRIYPPYRTEDICFYLDNKVDLTLVDIRLLHAKTVMM